MIRKAYYYVCIYIPYLKLSSFTVKIFLKSPCTCFLTAHCRRYSFYRLWSSFLQRWPRFVPSFCTQQTESFHISPRNQRSSERFACAVSSSLLDQTLIIMHLFLALTFLGTVSSVASNSLNFIATLSPRSDDSCTPLPLGKGPVPSLDSAYSFHAFQPLSDSAKKAPTPSGYRRTFENFHASSTATGFLGYDALDSYNTTACAERCNQKSECVAVNIFFERAPTKKPGPQCANPPSTTLIKCSFWSTAVSEENTDNAGHDERMFQAVIAGSNGYVKTDEVTGYQHYNSIARK